MSNFGGEKSNFLYKNVFDVYSHLPIKIAGFIKEKGGLFLQKLLKEEAEKMCLINEHSGTFLKIV